MQILLKNAIIGGHEHQRIALKISMMAAYVFLEYDGRPFLSQEHNYAFVINTDWFQS